MSFYGSYQFRNGHWEWIDYAKSKYMGRNGGLKLYDMKNGKYYLCDDSSGFIFITKNLKNARRILSYGSGQPYPFKGTQESDSFGIMG